jgi:hypothetical protein
VLGSGKGKAVREAAGEKVRIDLESNEIDRNMSKLLSSRRCGESTEVNINTKVKFVRG